MIEPMHLRIILALEQQGTLTSAATALNLTQSALSHQIRYLEKKLGVKLWHRNGRLLKLTQSGTLLLQTAKQVLPLLQQTEETVLAMANGQAGILRIGVECFPCQQWLNRILSTYLRAMPKVDLDVLNKFQFSGVEALINQHVDLLITPDRIQHKDLRYIGLFDYELLLLVCKQHPYAGKAYIEAGELATETLITFPVAQERLDVLIGFLWPADAAPAKHQSIASIDIMLQLTANNRGVCTLPNWLTSDYCKTLGLSSLRLGQHGLHKTLYACIRSQDADTPHLQEFIRLGQQLGANAKPVQHS